MGTFYLKRGDTNPVLRTPLMFKDGTIHDPTGGSVKLHIKLDNGTVLTRNMTIEDDDGTPVVQYIFLDTDWGADKIVPGTHEMEYEALNSPSRITFPNHGLNDQLVVTDDIADGAF